MAAMIPVVPPRTRQCIRCKILFLRWPHHALIHLCDRAETFIHELLHTLAAIGFCCVDVAFGICRDAVHAVEFTGLAAAVAEAGQDFETVAIENMYLVV